MATTPDRDPVTLYVTLAESLSRWLWIVKPLLLIPHYIVLAILGFAASITWVITLLAILFTGRYPRGLFDFHMGVFRWMWRVEFYGTQALATDMYPPFQFSGANDYPADIEIKYPENLNRWLVLIKLFLVIPHLIILGILRGGQNGLSMLLVFIAGIILLFTGKYPKGILDLLMGVHIWWYRTMAYVTFMTDSYPPFRLDVPPPLAHR
jgi:hypothetical protein